MQDNDDGEEHARKRIKLEESPSPVTASSSLSALSSMAAVSSAVTATPASFGSSLATAPSSGYLTQNRYAQTRIGAQFQARMPAPMLAQQHPASTMTSNIPSRAAASAAASIEGEPVFLSSRVKDQAKLDTFLRSVDALFYQSSEHSDEEKALELLHKCNYDMAAALELLQPWAKVEEEDEAQKATEFDSDDVCTVCGDGGDLIICDAKGCKRVWHAVCAELTEIPSGTWECSVHFCATCGQRVNESNSVRCQSCPTAYCAAHIPPYARQTSNQIQASDFKCPKCFGAKDGVQSDRRSFLKQFMAALSGGPVPTTGSKEGQGPTIHVNLKDLYKEITVRGGLEEVLTTSAWREIQRLFFHPISGSRQVKPTEK